MKKLLLTILTVFSTYTFANCEQSFFDQTRPSPSGGLEEVCFKQFTNLYDPKMKIPIYSSEYLTTSEAKASESVKRHDAFHPERQLKKNEQSLPSDYAHSGYDKGHLTPSHDAATSDTQNETFSMSNMVPQTKKSNEVAIRLIEAKVHDTVENGMNAYVLTGVIVSDHPKTIGNGVVVPDDTFKAVRFDDGSSCVWVFPNTEELSRNLLLSLSQFEHNYGITPFPSIASETKISKYCQ